MGRSRKRKRGYDDLRHIDGRVLPLLYPSSRLLTLHDLLVTLLLPSLRQHHATAPAVSPSSSSEAGKEAAFSDTLRQQSSPTEVIDDAIFSAAAHSLLVCEDDPAEYLSLLHSTYAVLPDTAPPIGGRALEQRWSHQQVIERVIQILFKQGSESSNVLCFGFQQPRPRSSLDREKIAPAGLACISDNAAVRILNSPAWRKIHSRVGDLIMLHLLSYADIFHPLPHKCYIQVAGTSVLLGRQNSNKNPVKWVKSIEKSVNERQDAFQKQRRIVGFGGKPCLLSDKANSHIQCSAPSCTKLSSKEMVSRVSVQDRNPRKRKRPHSWQRRKMARFLARQTEDKVSNNVLEQSQMRIDSDSKDCRFGALELCHSSFIDVIKSGPATQETVVGVVADALTNPRKVNKCPKTGPFFQQRLISTAARLELNPDNTAEDRKKQMAGFASSSLFAKRSYDNQQKQSKKIKGFEFGVPSASLCNTSGYHIGSGDGRRLINRSRMFYRAKFPHHAGLPKSHLLQRLKPTYKDAAILFHAIFGKESLCRCSKCICCLLKRFVSNAQKCQFAQLLKRHCTTSLSANPESDFPTQLVERKGLTRLVLRRFLLELKE